VALIVDVKPDGDKENLGEKKKKQGMKNGN